MPIVYGGGSTTETKKEKLYAALAKGNTTLLNTLLNDPVYQLIFSEMTFTSSAMNAIANSQTAMNAIANSQTALNAVANSQTAMNAIANSQTAMNAIANSQTAMNAVVNSQTAMNAVVNSQTAMNAIQSVASARQAFVNSTALPQRSVPTMTSNTTPEGQAIGSSFGGSGYEYFRAFDKNTSTEWWAASRVPQWVGYTFTVPVLVHQVRVVGYSSSGVGNNPTSITIQRSTNGTTWEDVATYNQEFTSAETVLNIPLKAGFYRYWRVYVNSTVSSSVNPDIRELNFIGFAQQ